jgi:hypothetical protein
MDEPETVTVLGQPSWRLASQDVEAFVTVRGGHTGPVTFRQGNRQIQPYAVAPWAEELVDTSLPAVIQVLRGDFFCLPFGAGEESQDDALNPPHGSAANDPWFFESLIREGSSVTLRLSQNSASPNGRIEKFVTLVDGHQVVYTSHVVSGVQGRMCLGHHAMLRFPDESGSGRVTLSRFRYGQVVPTPLESGDEARSMLRPGAVILNLELVPTMGGGITDISRYPARRGSEDLVMLVSDPALEFAWTAVTFPRQGYVWFALKNPRVLRQTILWLSNGGRHYPPWNGRHVGVMGLEEVTAYFHYGLERSAAPNPISKVGDPTYLTLASDHPLEVRYIAGIAPIPTDFERVADIRAHEDDDLITISSPDGFSVEIPVQHRFLKP